MCKTGVTPTSGAVFNGSRGNWWVGRESPWKCSLAPAVEGLCRAEDLWVVGGSGWLKLGKWYNGPVVKEDHIGARKD